MIKYTFDKSDMLLTIAKLSAAMQSLDEKKKYDIELKEHRERRSLDANAYFWVLCSKLAEKTGISQTALYQSLIVEIGGNNETVCVPTKAVERLRSGWEHNGIGWTSKAFESKIKGCTNVILYYGSSTYDTAQMSRLIDLIVQECKQQGIETMTPQQLEILKDGWNG